MKAYQTIVPALLGIAVGGCHSLPEVVQLSPDTYIATKSSVADLASLKAQVIREANAFAEKQGKIAIAISSNERPADKIGALSFFEYQFRVVDKNDPEARRTSLMPRPDVVIEQPVDGRGSPDRTSVLYQELLKLDDLRNRGILTRDEFEVEKKRLLDAKK